MPVDWNSLPPDVFGKVIAYLQDYHCRGFLVVRQGSPEKKTLGCYPRWFQNSFNTYCFTDEGNTRTLLKRKGFSNIFGLGTETTLSWDEVLYFVVDVMMARGIAKLHFFATYAAPEFEDVVFLKRFNQKLLVSVRCRGSWSRHRILVNHGRYTTIESHPVSSYRLLHQAMNAVAQGSPYRESGWPGMEWALDREGPISHVLLVFKRQLKPMILTIGGTWKSLPWRKQTWNNFAILGDAQVQDYPPHLQSNWRHSPAHFQRLRTWIFGTCEVDSDSD